MCRWRFESGRGQGDASHCSVEFRKFLDRIEETGPEDLDIHLILDKQGPHKTALIRNWLAKRPRFHLYFTPTGASWMNFVERFSRGRHPPAP
jgi:transposase